jgi:ATP-dependent phosphoenolpyruvate carboxykinase
MLPEHIGSCDPNVFQTTITDTGALSCSSGLRTGRSPKDKRVVLDETTKDVIIKEALNILLRSSGGVTLTFQSTLRDTPETEGESLISSTSDPE